MPVTSMKPHAAYYAKLSVEKQHMAVYTEKFLSLPRFLHDTQAKRDRHKGASFFDDFIPGIISCNCASHILQNTRKNAPVAQKGFHDNMFWAVQGAKSLGEYFCNLTKFQNNYPQVKQYLESIPREQWVHFAQFAAGAHTYGWRTSNMAESSQSWAKKMRSMYPLDFYNAFFTKCSIVVTRELQNQKKMGQKCRMFCCRPCSMGGK